MKINIDITEEQAKFLRQFAKNQHEGAKDNLGTRKPLHLVQTGRDEVVWDGGEDGDETAYWSSDLQELYADEVKLVRDLTGKEDVLPYDEAEFTFINGLQVLDIDDYFEAYGAEGCCKVSIVHMYDTAAYFFTLEEAKKYLKYQSHNLNRPRIYTVGGGYGNNGDYEPFYDLLMSIGMELLKEK